MPRTVVIMSGGIDSTTLLYELIAAGHIVKALSVNYGQRHCRELEAAAHLCTTLAIEHQQIELSATRELFGGNSLMDFAAPIPAGEYSATTMPQTTVPNRNMLLLSLAIGWAISIDYEGVAFGAHAGTTVTYPDCRPEFAAAMHQAALLCDWQPIAVLAPFVTWTKGEVVRRGASLGVPFEWTWSCYQGRERHCGICGTCIDRRRAFIAAGVPDPTDYES